MLQLTYTIALSFLEITFVMVGLLLLHSLRKQIGSASFYLAMGTLFVVTQLVAATSLKVVVGFQGVDFYIASTVLFLPYLAAILVVYVTEGTLATQRLIIGAMGTLGVYLYLSYLTSVQCSWEGYQISQGPSADALNFLLMQSQRTMAGSILALSLDLFLIPIFFQRLRNLGSRMFFAVLGSLMLTQIVDTIIYVTASYWGEPVWWLQISSSYIAKAVSTIWLSVLVSIYLMRIEREIPGEGRGALDIVLAFFGGYGKAVSLERNLRDWEGRYRRVIENASDMILIVESSGEILDSNPAAVRILRQGAPSDLIGSSFLSLVENPILFHPVWNKLWGGQEAPEGEASPPANIDLALKAADGGVVDLSAAFSMTTLTKNKVLIVFGRDVSEQNRLVREREELKGQLDHTQRLESIGQLAGGIAHDFNNMLHAIQGQVDLILTFDEIKDQATVRHLASIRKIVDKASDLTTKLLGFARRGKYREGVVDLAHVLRETREMFLPLSQKSLNFNLRIPSRRFLVLGDAVQLQQIFLNLLINAMDATEGNKDRPREIVVELGETREFPDDWHPLDAGIQPHNYFQVCITDNGVGMDKETKARIFEPFFTTKPVGKGTGMGLAMVYGGITGHKGHIHVDSAKNEGTRFYIFLPRLPDNVVAHP